MSYFATTFVIFAFALIETSLLPHFKILGAVPFITLALIAAISVKYRGFAHLFVAFAAGLYFDFISSGVPGLFTGVFVTVALLGRVVFFRDTGYDSTQSFLWLLGLSALFLYLVNGYILVGLSFSGWQSYLIIAVSGVVLTMLVGSAILRFSDGFVSWLNKESEERFR